MHPPTGKFSKLSLNKPGMTPVTRSHGHGGADTSGSTTGGPSQSPPEERGNQQPDADGSEDDSEDNGSTDDEEEDDDGPVRSPLTGLSYNVDNLDDETQELVRELFRPPAPEETPPMVIEWCGISNDPDVYAFQLQEVVPRTIRIGSPTSRIPRPSCNCTGTANTPCRHLVWLMDQIAKQTLHDHHPDVPLVLDEATAFPKELPDAYSNISDFHIDILANTLHCGAGPPVTGRPNLHRVREAREILAGLDGVQDDEGVDKYAPEIFSQSKTDLESFLWGNERREDGEDDEDGESDDGSDQMDEDEVEVLGKEGTKDDAKDDVAQKQQQQQQQRKHRSTDQPTQVVRDLVERGDLQRTVLRLLVSNDEFFTMFLKLLAPSDKARDPFRKIQQRVEAVLDALLAVKPSTTQQQQQQQQSRLLMPPPDPRTRRASSTPTTPIITVTEVGSAPESASGAGVTVAWAAQHVQHAVHQIHLLLQRQLPRPPGAWARRSAGRALLWILHALVFSHNRDAHAGATQDDRNLYQRLVGNSDGTAPGSSLSSPGGKGFFLLDVLAPLHDQTHLRSQLKRIRRRIQVNGYREPYMKRLDELLGLMNAAAEKEEKEDQTPLLVPPSTAGSKRHGSNTNTPTDRRPKRMR